MSSPEPAELQVDAPVDAIAFESLEQLVRALGEELSRFRKRALVAETRLKELESSPSADLFAGERLAALDAENRELRERLEQAAGRMRVTLDRVRFLRQQTSRPLGNGAAHAGADA